jgi:hypothetical protein
MNEIKVVLKNRTVYGEHLFDVPVGTILVVTNSLRGGKDRDGYVFIKTEGVNSMTDLKTGKCYGSNWGGYTFEIFTKITIE